MSVSIPLPLRPRWRRPRRTTALLLLVVTVQFGDSGRRGGRRAASAFRAAPPPGVAWAGALRAASSPPPAGAASGDATADRRAVLASLAALKSGSDLRGTFVDHADGPVAPLALATLLAVGGGAPAAALTPFAARCFGAAFARWLAARGAGGPGGGLATALCVGRDPRPHGARLAAAFTRGFTDVEGGSGVADTGVATTPAMCEFVRAGKCGAAIMITASHLPEEKNGMKFFAAGTGGLTAKEVDELILLAQEEAGRWCDGGILPADKGFAETVDFMPYYKETLKQAILREVGGSATSIVSGRPLSSLNVVVNPGNGAGCFFDVLLQDLGAYVANSIHTTPDGTFPKTFGVPNPEKPAMVEETIRACQACNADIGVMFDTDADRAGFVLPRTVDEKGIRADYEPLNGNRMIALIGAIFAASSPGCTIVTDSTTSEGLSAFLEQELGLRHYRYVRGYANVIGKAAELTASGAANAEVAIEISGHCAMKENGYVDDGTYTAVKIIGLLARTAAAAAASGGTGDLFDLIAGFDEMPFEREARIRATDGSLETTSRAFRRLAQSLEEQCDKDDDWSLDEYNQEGVRVRMSSGGHFMIRQSLHDPVISMQVESISKEEAREKVFEPLLGLLSKYDTLDYSALKNLA